MKRLCNYLAAVILIVFVAPLGVKIWYAIIKPTYDNIINFYRENTVAAYAVTFLLALIAISAISEATKKGKG